jgi:hypothetical protein
MEMVSWEGFSEANIENEIIRFHRVKLNLAELRAKYSKEIDSDEEQRRILQERMSRRIN